MTDQRTMITGITQSARDEFERSVWYSGYLLTFLATSDDTGGAFSLVEEFGKKGQSVEPPMHVHSREEEAFYVIEGRMTFYVADAVIDASEGSFVSLPKNVPHRFELASDTVRCLNLCVPAGFEGFFRDLSEPAQSLELPPRSDEPLNIPQLIETAARYGVEILPPEQNSG